MSLLLHHSVVASKLSNPQALPPSLLTNLVAWWKLDETSGNRVNCINPGVYDMTAVGNPAIEAGIISNAYTVTIPDPNYILRTPNAPVFAATQDISFHGWVKLKSGAAFRIARLLYNIDAATLHTNYWMNISTDTGGNGSITVVTSADSIGGNTAPGGMPYDIFHHIAVTMEYSTKRIKIYLNGGLLANVVAAGQPTDTQASCFLSIGQIIGANPYVNTSYDEIGFWPNRIITQADVTALYNNGAGVSP